MCKWKAVKPLETNREYHIVSDGELTKDSNTIVFISGDTVTKIPFNNVDYLNIYGKVSINHNVFKTFGDHKVRLNLFNEYGELTGYYIPEQFHHQSETLLNQCRLYIDNKKRLEIAKRIEKASFHNMRANIRYYGKKRESITKDDVNEFTEGISRIQDAGSINDLMLMEARIRQKYYSCFSSIITNTNFYFENRSKRPPLDPFNAMISFGNSLLYSDFLKAIWRNGLDPQIGIVHATNDRYYSLNLDYADVYKPIVTDRLTFSLINKNMIDADEHFTYNTDGSVYLNSTGKRMYLDVYRRKVQESMNRNGNKISYQQLMNNEIAQLKKYIYEGVVIHPFKYY